MRPPSLPFLRPRGFLPSPPAANLRAALRHGTIITLVQLRTPRNFCRQTNNNYGCGSLSQNATIQAAYALYLARAAKAYRAAGLNFEHLAIQNEPNQGSLWNGHSCGQSYPKMHWTGAQLHSFLKSHLGPAFEAEGAPLAREWI